MPVWLTALVPAAIGFLKDIFKINSDNKTKRDIAVQEAKKAEAESKTAGSNKNASLAKYNKHIYIMLTIAAIVVGLLIAGILPDYVIIFFENLKKVFSPDTLDRILTLLEELVRALAGITDQ